MPAPRTTRTALRVCPLCEATCGLTLTIEGTRVTGARGDRDDVFSKGFICPKGASFGAADSDPDRLRLPLVRRNGRLEEATWEEAFDAVAAALPPLAGTHGPDSVGVVLGNPNVHTMAGALYPPLLLGLLGTRNVFTASTLDQMPKHVSSGLLFGDALAIPVPDLDRTDHLLILGANPLESNGSLCTAPDFPGRLKALRARGGTLTVIDPRRTRTARLADRHLAIRPGTDALLLAAMVQVLFEEDLVRPGALAEHLEGLSELRVALGEFTPDLVAPDCDVPAAVIRTLARELAAAPTAAVYGRVGGSTVPFGTLTNWLVEVLNILTGNLDRPGGALFPLSATDRAPRPAGPGKGFALGRWSSRISGHPEAKGELPLAALAEEIEGAAGPDGPDGPDEKTGATPAPAEATPAPGAALAASAPGATSAAPTVGAAPAPGAAPSGTARSATSALGSTPAEASPGAASGPGTAPAEAAPGAASAPGTAPAGAAPGAAPAVPTVGAAPAPGAALTSDAVPTPGTASTSGTASTASTPGAPQAPAGSRIRALITVAANPVLSAPDGDRLDRALESLDFMVAVDPYLNETTRHADVVLPPPPPSQSAHFDFAFNALAVRNQVRYTPAAIPLDEGRMAETEIHARLVAVVGGMHGAGPAAVDAMVVDRILGKAVADPHSPVHGRDPAELAARLAGTTGPERRLDLMLRLGPYGDGFREVPGDEAPESAAPPAPEAAAPPAPESASSAPEPATATATAIGPGVRAALNSGSVAPSVPGSAAPEPANATGPGARAALNPGSAAPSTPGSADVSAPGIGVGVRAAVDPGSVAPSVPGAASASDAGPGVGGGVAVDPGSVVSAPALGLAVLLAHPHGIDLGALAPRLPGPLKTRSGRIELLPAPIAGDLPRLRAAVGAHAGGQAGGLVLVGRRHLRSNNSWMHNLRELTGGSNRCTLQVHPVDAARLGLTDGTPVRIKGAGGEVTAPAEVTEGVRPGVVSLPHGWGHDRPGTRLTVAAQDPGVNVNQLMDGALLDPLSGTSVLNAVPVQLTAAG